MYIGYTSTLPHTSPMSAPVGENTNQLSENIYCNSEAYNVIYDANYIMSTLTAMRPAVNTLLNNNTIYFSRYLDTHIGVPVPGNEVQIPPEFNRLNMRVSSFVAMRHPGLIIYVIYLKYEFEYYDVSNHYIPGDPYTMHNQNCEYVQYLGKNWHKFVTFPIDMLHFSFHDIAVSLSSRAKSVGSFHLRFDYINMKVFRPFIIHPLKTGYQFYKFADFSRHLLNYYTTEYYQILMNLLHI
jgi:hypothetical protein